MTHGISQVRILEWVAVFLLQGSSDLAIELRSLKFPTLVGRFFLVKSPMFVSQ